MNGREAIINKIALNAEDKKRDILAAAKAEADEIMLVAAAKAQAISDAAKAAAKYKADVIYENRMAMATRQSKNIVLNAKQAILDEIYEEARQKIVKMPAADYKKFLGALVDKYAESGDSAVPGKEDKKLFTAEFVTGLSKKAKLSLSKETGAFDKGLLLSNKSSERNLSLEMIMRMARENSEAEVLKLCFEVK
jgi:V/A-type H+-transporting ATPase subunit E